MNAVHQHSDAPEAHLHYSGELPQHIAHITSIYFKLRSRSRESNGNTCASAHSHFMRLSNKDVQERTYGSLGTIPNARMIIHLRRVSNLLKSYRELPAERTISVLRKDIEESSELSSGSRFLHHRSILGLIQRHHAKLITYTQNRHTTQS